MKKRSSRQAAVFVPSQVTVGDKETSEQRVHVSDLPSRAKPLGGATRKHWGIENGQHGGQEVQMSENSAWQQDRRGAANLALPNRDCW